MEHLSLTLVVWQHQKGSKFILKKKAIGQSGSSCQFNSTERGEDVTTRVFNNKKKVKQSGYRKLSFPDFIATSLDGGKVVSLTHRPPFTPRKYTWYSFLLEALSRVFNNILS